MVSTPDLRIFIVEHYFAEELEKRFELYACKFEDAPTLNRKNICGSQINSAKQVQ